MLRFGKKVIVAVAAVLALTLSFQALDYGAPERMERIELTEMTDATPDFSAATVSEDVLWLARCIYSETKRPEEQELVAWVIRNRVETGYRGQSSFRGTVLDPFQFSAFNPGTSHRRIYTSLNPTSQSRGWQTAMEIAHNVYYSPSEARPFPSQTRHFYSERSMQGGAPDWARGKTPIRVTTHRLDPRRFRFYASIA